MSERAEGAEARHPVAAGPFAAAAAVDGRAETRRKGWPSPLVSLAVAVALAILGAPLGLLWRALAPDIPLIKVEGGARLTDPQPEEYVAADGWFTLLGLGFGVLAAIAVWVLLRRYRGPVVLLGLAVGTVGAALVAWWLGSLIGHGDFDRLLASAPAGTPLSQPAELRAGGFEWLWGVIPTLQGDVLLPAFGAVVIYTLLAGWSRYPSLVPEPEPVTPLALAAAAEPTPDGGLAGPWHPPAGVARPPAGPDWRPQPINGMGIDGGGPSKDRMPGAGPWASPPPGTDRG
ncbi:DUF2567 domain-containing protein [Phytohabitans sp. ZYX-F-186]|uniref:DUF2567 domain-containing protein n=1 Tax=Phytohabitans maris TaxID=3071409 RepID=A0ABU0ZBU7_9ACTN|nr:DUF2567 domain-containing protein [Phytohabitans sp. ZYX-F-186]MDQ7904541.1 DUF2567 domain-containing protein [Phytohabitans sp. ZYX-F-186]